MRDPIVRERKSGLSLDFPAFGSSVLFGPRSKAVLRGKGYAWVLIFLEFRQLQEVGIFSYMVYSLAMSHFYGWGFVEAWMAVFSVSKSLNQVNKIPIVWP